ncbi:MAG: potassium channel family protein [Desulfobacteraceae bacterium]
MQEAPFIKHSWKIDNYVVICFVVEVIFYSFSGIPLFHSLWAKWALFGLFTLKALEITAVAMKVSVLSRVGRPKKEKRHIGSHERMIVLAMINYLELIVIFATFYRLFQNKLLGATTFYDPLYFSVMTQLTIGYGDITPLGALKILVCVQCLIGLFVLVGVIARYIALLRAPISFSD